MMGPFKIGTVVAIALLGATAMGVVLLLMRHPDLLKQLVKQGAMTYQRAMTLLAEVREELGDRVAEALYEAEQELREADPDLGVESAAGERRAVNR
jgi:hypothetical protein